jgi:hypothetical protein
MIHLPIHRPVLINHERYTNMHHYLSSFFFDPFYYKQFANNFNRKALSL